MQIKFHLLSLWLLLCCVLKQGSRSLAEFLKLEPRGCFGHFADCFVHPGHFLPPDIKTPCIWHRARASKERVDLKSMSEMAEETQWQRLCVAAKKNKTAPGITAPIC